MKKIILTSLMASLALFSCENENNVDPSHKEGETTNTPSDTLNEEIAMDISYTLAKNYFVKNTIEVEETTVVKITNKNELDSLFGPATTMAEEGKPTEIDFEKHYAIAVIEPKTEMGDSLQSITLAKLKESIIVSVNYKKGEKQTFTSKPYVLLIVDKSIEGKIELKK